MLADYSDVERMLGGDQPNASVSGPEKRVRAG
jgi:hypothetical protein